MNRNLDLEGCFNSRDLGGLPTAGGGRTAVGAVIRSDSLHRLTARGWSALWDHGVRTVIDLRNADEYEADVAPRPPRLETISLRLPLSASRCSIAGQGTPLHYPRILQRSAECTSRVVRAVASAAPGGVAVHCVAGRDRTGLVSLLLLALAGVPPADIADDYELSSERLAGLYAAAGEPDRQDELEAPLRRAGTTAAAAVAAAAAGLDPVGHLRAGGLTDTEIRAARARLTGRPF